VLSVGTEINDLEWLLHTPIALYGTMLLLPLAASCSLIVTA